jgi:hypothetical protein
VTRYNFRLGDFGSGRGGADRDAPRAPRAQRLQPRKRLVVDHGQTFTAFDAHDLLDMDSHAKYGRPGMGY